MLRAIILEIGGSIAGKGILLFLNKLGCWPDRWVAERLGDVHNYISPEWLSWCFAAFAATAIIALLYLYPKTRHLIYTPKQGNEPSLDRARGDALWLKNQSLSRSMRAMDQESLDRYHNLKNSDHIVWTDQETNSARNHFLHYVGLVIDRDVFNTADEFRDAEAELQRWWGILDGKLSQWRR